MKAKNFLTRLKQNNFNFFTGVPCSYLTPLIDLLSPLPPKQHIPAPREDIAVGIAAGAYLAGSTPVIYMQNSGLGYSLEAFASIHMIYNIPALVLATYRGPADKGWEEHQVMGDHTEELLKTFGFRYSILEESFDQTKIETIKSYLQQSLKPYVLLIKKGALT
jgi:phosphonopyruvate decarboxylase